MKKPCDIATGGFLRRGYVRYKRKVNGRWKNVSAHREAWEAINGPIPPGLFVLHKCDNRRCREPEHLFLGTHQDNMADCKAKGRTRIGRRNHNAVLHPANVRHIRASKLSGLELADIYEVTPSTISKIRMRRIWGHIA